MDVENENFLYFTFQPSRPIYISENLAATTEVLDNIAYYDIYSTVFIRR
jgi:hypothetical protein